VSVAQDSPTKKPTHNKDLMKKHSQKKRVITTQVYNLATFSDESLRTIIEKSSSPAMVEAARAVMDKRKVPFPSRT
jgi:hypothetical protein